MISRPANVGAASAMEYFTESKDNYYQKEGSLGTWQGKAAEELGLSGEINSKDLENVLWGRDKDGNQLVQARLDKNGDRKRAGLDLTFSAPKSVSVLYEAAKGYGEDRAAKEIEDAHNKAVSKILEKTENNFAQGRVKQDDGYKPVDTGKFAIAKFTHDVARPVEGPDGKATVDPALHTHSVIMNMTKTGDKWSTIESKEIFQHFKALGQQYRNELAANLNELGYETQVTDPKKGFFDVTNTAKDDLLQEFSKRGEQLEGKVLDDLRKEYPNATEGHLKQLAAWKSREWKGEIDRSQVRSDNVKRMEEMGYGKEVLQRGEVKQPKSMEVQVSMAKDYVKNAIAAKHDQDAVFNREEVMDYAGKMSLHAPVQLEALETAFEGLMNERGDNQVHQVSKNFYTTGEFLRKESEIQAELKDKGNFTAEYAKSAAKDLVQKYSDKKQEDGDFALTKGQNKSAALILGSKDHVIGVQGDAGTGKTTMLQAVNELNDSQKILGLSYTGKAAGEIQKATKSKENFDDAGIESMTVTKFLKQMKDKKADELRGGKLVVDEASMLGMRDAHELVKFAKENDTQLVMMGDTKQLKAIAAGDSFGMMQESGMSTVKMADVIRQKDPILKEAVAALGNKDASRALDILDENNMVHKTAAGKDDLVNDFFETGKTDDSQVVVPGDSEDLKDNLVLVSTNKDKDDLNQMIRDKFKERGEVEQDDFSITTRESTRLRPSEKYIAANYKKGNKLFLQSSVGDLKAGSELEISGIDEKNNMLSVVDKEGNESFVDTKRSGPALQEYKEEKKDFSRGDKIVFGKNDKKLGVKNGETGIVQNIDKDGNLQVVDKEGKVTSFNTQNYSYIDRGYAVTNHKAQGQTSGNVFAFVESKSQSFNSFYVAVTRAKNNLQIYTDSKENLRDNISKEEEKKNALDQFKKMADKKGEIATDLEKGSYGKAAAKYAKARVDLQREERAAFERAFENRENKIALSLKKAGQSLRAGMQKIKQKLQKQKQKEELLKKEAAAERQQRVQQRQKER